MSLNRYILFFWFIWWIKSKKAIDLLFRLSILLLNWSILCRYSTHEYRKLIQYTIIVFIIFFNLSFKLFSCSLQLILRPCLFCKLYNLVTCQVHQLLIRQHLHSCCIEPSYLFHWRAVLSFFDMWTWFFLSMLLRQPLLSRHGGALGRQIWMGFILVYSIGGSYCSTFYSSYNNILSFFFFWFWLLCLSKCILLVHCIHWPLATFDELIHYNLLLVLRYVLVLPTTRHLCQSTFILFCCWLKHYLL